MLFDILVLTCLLQGTRFEEEGVCIHSDIGGFLRQ